MTGDRWEGGGRGFWSCLLFVFPPFEVSRFLLFLMFLFSFTVFFFFHLNLKSISDLFIRLSPAHLSPSSILSPHSTFHFNLLSTMLFVSISLILLIMLSFLSFLILSYVLVSSTSPFVHHPCLLEPHTASVIKD